MKEVHLDLPTLDNFAQVTVNDHWLHGVNFLPHELDFGNVIEHVDFFIEDVGKAKLQKGIPANVVAGITFIVVHDQNRIRVFDEVVVPANEVFCNFLPRPFYAANFFHLVIGVLRGPFWDVARMSSVFELRFCFEEIFRKCHAAANGNFHSLRGAREHHEDISKIRLIQRFREVRL